MTVWGWECVHLLLHFIPVIDFCWDKESKSTLAQSYHTSTVIICNKLAFRLDFYSLEKPQSLRDFFLTTNKVLTSTVFDICQNRLLSKKWKLIHREFKYTAYPVQFSSVQFSSASLTATVTIFTTSISLKFLTHCINWLQKSWKRAQVIWIIVMIYLWWFWPIWGIEIPKTVNILLFM